jgi:lipopolysaccharide transport system ATP-binding protein
MGEVSKGEGRTVLFVSHNMAAVKQLCNKGVLLENGKLKDFDTSGKIVHQYIENNLTVNNYINNDFSKPFLIKKFELIDNNSVPKNIFEVGDIIRINFEYDYLKFNENVEYSFALFNSNNLRIFTINGRLSSESKNILFDVSNKFLTPGCYFFNIALHIPNQILYDFANNICGFNLINTHSDIFTFEGQDIGVIYPSFNIIENEIQ